MEIEDKIIIVTGASRGIGLATARYLAKEGAKVVLAARSTDILKQLGKEIPGSFVVTADMRKPKNIKNLMDATVKHCGRIDVLINNAGQGMYGPVETIDVDKYKEIMELNVYGVLRAMQAVIPIMRKQSGGQIINVSSGLAKVYIPQIAAYSSTKYALDAISFIASQELEKDKIIVSVIRPRMTATNFGKNSIGERPDWVTDPNEWRTSPEVDAPKKVAEKIGELIRTGQREMWMDERA